MNYESYLNVLKQSAEPDYAQFQRKIVSDTRYPILGVQMPVIRRLARQAAQEDWQCFLSSCRYETYEQTMLAGLTVVYAKTPIREKLAALWQLLPRLDSWALTDSIVPTLKPRPEELPALWQFALECLKGEGEYTIRFGIVILLNHFLTAEYIPQVAEKLCAIHDERYYVGMVVSWCLAEMAVKDYERVEAILKSGSLDLFVHNKSIQKIQESYRITKEHKATVELLRRK